MNTALPSRRAQALLLIASLCAIAVMVVALFASGGSGSLSKGAGVLPKEAVHSKEIKTKPALKEWLHEKGDRQMMDLRKGSLTP